MADGSVEKCKAQKVGRGFTQEQGVNYDEIYAQMMRPETLKMPLVIALYRDWEIRQWDVVAAYLQADLHHKVYVSNVNEKGEIEYWKLNKALYGLKQAGHEWYKTLQKILEIAGLKKCIGDEGTYVNNNGDTIVGTHVGDLIGNAPQGKDLDNVEASYEKSVELDKRGKPEKLLGMELSWRKNEVVLTQQVLIETMTKTHLANQDDTGYKKPSLPLDKQQFEPPNELVERLEDPKRFQALVGGLRFISRMTRPNISIQVNLLGRRASDPSKMNLQAAMATLKYLWQTRSEGIILRKPRDLTLTAYADASYGGEESRSQSGVLLTLGNQPIGWYSRRQDIVALSITEAEYIADCEAAKDLAWATLFLKELSIEKPLPVLKTDSEGVYNLSQAAKFLRRSWHMEHRYHYLRQQVQNGSLTIRTISGKDNPSDHLTKLVPDNKNPYLEGYIDEWEAWFRRMNDNHL